MKKPAKVEEANRNIALAATNKAENDLKFHEAGLRDNADAMSAFSIHLYQIKAKALWQIPGCTSFKHYCETRVMPLLKIPLSLTRLYQLAEFEEVRAELPPAVSTIVETESQARELAKAPKAKRAKIVKEVAKKGNVTAKAIAAEVKKQKPIAAEFQQIVCDDLGQELPEEIVFDWNRSRDQCKEWLGQLSAMRTAIKSDDLIYSEVKGAVETIDSAYTQVKNIGGSVKCPVCDAKPTLRPKCKTCNKRGYVSKFFHSQNAKKK